MPAPDLDGAQRRFLRARAHPLRPLVQVGEAGLTEAVVAALDRALLDHELVKVRLRAPEDRHAVARALAERVEAALCGVVGHTVILYRPHPHEPRLALPARGSRGGGGASDSQDSEPPLMDRRRGCARR